MQKIVVIKCGAFSKTDPSFLRQAFTKKSMPKLYHFIEMATQKLLKDKSSLPRYWGRIAFYDDDRSLTGKTGSHLINKFHARTDTTGTGEELVISNSKQVGKWNLFWMLTEGTRWYNASPKFMHFFDRYGSESGQQGFKRVRFRKGNERFVPLFNTWLEKQAQAGVEKGVEQWVNSGTMETEFGKVLKRAGFKFEE